MKSICIYACKGSGNYIPRKKIYHSITSLPSGSQDKSKPVAVGTNETMVGGDGVNGSATAETGADQSEMES